MYQLEYAGHMKLKHVKPGQIFRLPGEHGELAMMTLYGDNSGHRHSYFLESGGSCWLDLEAEVIALNVVPTGDEDEYLKPSDLEYRPAHPREVPVEKVPEDSRNFAAGDMKAFDKQPEFHIYEVGMGSEKRKIKAVSAAAAALHYGVYLANTNNPLMVAVYTEDDQPFTGEKWWMSLNPTPEFLESVLKRITAEAIKSSEVIG